MNAGKLKNISKYEVWVLRGVKLQARNKAGGTVNAPLDMSLIQYVKDGIAQLPEDLTDNAVNEMAKKLKIGAETFRMIRGMILLSERPELTRSDRAKVLGLLEKVDRTRNVRPYFQEVKPLIDRIWGSTRNKSLTEKTSKKRTEHFTKAIIILRDMTERILEMEMPYMSREDIGKCINDLTETRKNVGKVAENLRRSKND